MTKYLKQFKFDNLILIIMILFISIMQVGTSLVHTYALNALLNDGIRQFLVWYAIALIMWIFLLLIGYFKDIFQQKTIQKMSITLREELTEDISKMDYERYNENTIGNYSSWLNNDISMIENAGFINFYILIQTIFVTILSLITLFQFHYSIMLVTIFFTVIMTFIPKYLSEKIKQATYSVSKQNEIFMSRVQNLFEGFDVLFFSNKTNKMSSFIKSYSEDLADVKVSYAKQSGAVTFWISILSVFSQLVIFVLTGVLAWLRVVSYGTITSTGSIAGNVFSSLSQFNGIIIQMKSVSSIFEKYESNLNFEQPILKPFNQSFEKISIEDLSYKYGETDVFGNLNLEFKKGGKYAIIGASGKGKSTLIKILLGAKRDYIGSVKLNDHEIKEIESTSVYNLMGFINQDNFIFNGTAKDNITLWGDYSDEKLKDVVEYSNLDEIGKLSEELGNGKRQLSEGQKQRISIARTVIQDKQILVIDEGTANLDVENAEFIEKQLLTDKNLTVIMVTHHLKENLVKYYDNIITL